MQLVNVLAARSTWFLELGDLNPRGKNISVELIAWLKDNYEFAIVPSSVNDLDPTTKGLMFKQGSFQAKEEIFVGVELGIFNDGFIATTMSNTKDSDGFLQDMLSTAARDFSLSYSPQMIRAKMYISELNVRLDRPLPSLDPRLAPLAAKITAACGQKNIQPFELGGVSFWTDTSDLAIKLSRFTIERRINAPFEENRFYAKASLQTDDHVKLLEEFELLLAT